jgi:2-(1,2-epoxy-1,2-dihydrophenyl)acetyl-CoA isomerase
MTTEVKSEMRGAALIVTFAIPDRANAFTVEMAQQLFNILKPVATTPAIRAVLLRGQGGHFLGDIDMNAYGGDFATGVERVNQMFQPYHSSIRELQVMEKPVLAAVEGTITGAGFSMMLAADLVLAARSTKFSAGFVSYACTPHGGASFFLTRKAGLPKALELMMLNETFGAEDALGYRLVNRLVDDDKLGAESLAWIDRLAEGPTKAMGGVKRLAMKAFDQDVNGQLGLEHALWGASTRSFDFRDAIKAFFAKRPPKFTGT